MSRPTADAKAGTRGREAGQGWLPRGAFLGTRGQGDAAAVGRRRRRTHVGSRRDTRG